MEIVRFAVVGYGHIGKRHAAMIRGHKEAELVAVVDIDDVNINIEIRSIPKKIADFIFISLGYKHLLLY